MDDLQKPLTLVLARLRELIREDPVLRQRVSELCGALLGENPTRPFQTAAEGNPVPSVSEAAPAPAPSQVLREVPPPPADRISPEEALQRLDIGADAPAPVLDYADRQAAAVPGTMPSPVPLRSLADAGARCRSKAERLKQLCKPASKGARPPEPDAGRFDDSLIPALRAGVSSVSAEQLGTLAGCYGVLAEAINCCVKAVEKDDHDTIESMFAHLAEASNALRICSHELAPGTVHDSDQDLSHKYLKSETKTRQILILKYMKRTDRAEPKLHAERRLRLQADAARFGLIPNPSDPATKAINKLEYDLERAPADDLTKPLGYLQQQLRQGVLRPSDPALAACLLPFLDRIKVDLEVAGQITDAVRFAIQVRDKASRPVVAISQQSTPSLESVVTKVVAEFPDRLVLCLNSRSVLAGNPFEDTDDAEKGLYFLATTYYLARTGEVPCPNLPKACREQSRFDFSSHQSETTMGQYENEYHTTFEGEKLTLEAHLRTGVSKDPRHALRIAFHWHERRKLIVIGYIGQHQRNRKT